MPQISCFLGVIIRMFYRDHNPPHFHAVYANFEGIIDIEKNEIIGGHLPFRVLGIVKEWASLHQNELMDNWERARRQESLKEIAPLVQQYNERIIAFWDAIPVEKANYSYGPGKWTIKQMFQHVIDTERIFAYRALAIARGEATPIPGFDENEYANNATAANRNWKDMLVEWRVVRQSTNLLYASFTEEQLKRLGTASDNPISVNALGFIIFGHALHHLHILKERYHI